MTYLALLRGVNVGGTGKVEMKALRLAFEDAGMIGVRTYINSGNVIFRAEGRTPGELRLHLEAVIAEQFGFHVDVVLRDLATVLATEAVLPDSWANDAEAKCDVMFLADDLSPDELVSRAVITDGIDEVLVAPGAVIWHIDRKNVNRGGALKLIGTDLYKRMTVRNCNTLRKLAAIMREVDEAAE